MLRPVIRLADDSAGRVRRPVCVGAAAALRRRIEAGPQAASGSAPGGVQPARPVHARGRRVESGGDGRHRRGVDAPPRTRPKQATQAVDKDTDSAAAILEDLGDRDGARTQLDRSRRALRNTASSTRRSCRWRSRTPTSRRSGWRSGRRRTPSPRIGSRSRPAAKMAAPNERRRGRRARGPGDRRGARDSGDRGAAHRGIRRGGDDAHGGGDDGVEGRRAERRSRR